LNKLQQERGGTLTTGLSVLVTNVINKVAISLFPRTLAAAAAVIQTMKMKK